uniref:Dystrophin n=1 Tax=Hucho hucho TaxID=62062 RepID=A0A4W5LFV5_9TELE
MDLQHQQLMQLTDWLELTEGRIKRMGAQPMGPDLEDVKHQVEEHKLLQEDLELEQVRVNSLTHMVVVVDENSGDSATAALEEKLQVRQAGHTYTHTRNRNRVIMHKLSVLIH